jgi:hypothetical protein
VPGGGPCCVVFMTSLSALFAHPGRCKENPSSSCLCAALGRKVGHESNNTLPQCLWQVWQARDANVRAERHIEEECGTREPRQTGRIGPDPRAAVGPVISRADVSAHTCIFVVGRRIDRLAHALEQMSGTKATIGKDGSIYSPDTTDSAGKYQ